MNKKLLWIGLALLALIMVGTCDSDENESADSEIIAEQTDGEEDFIYTDGKNVYEDSTFVYTQDSEAGESSADSTGFDHTPSCFPLVSGKYKAINTGTVVIVSLPDADNNTMLVLAGKDGNTVTYEIKVPFEENLRNGEWFSYGNPGTFDKFTILPTTDEIIFSAISVAVSYNGQELAPQTFTFQLKLVEEMTAEEARMMIIYLQQLVHK